MITPDFSHESLYQGRVCGIDEAGRGPWAGPVVAATASFNTHTPIAGLNDSKKLSEAKREMLFDQVMTQCDVGVGIATVEEIDSLNILAATKLAMQRAVSRLSFTPEHALIDGNQPVTLPCSCTPIIKGDSLSQSIAAASIIAKVTRDRMMYELAQQYPHYGWDSNAGYGTKAHQEGLATHGLTPHHRRSFAPIKKLLSANTH
jgi:ribonuclease HII